jgi:hypothetical protein
MLTGLAALESTDWARLHHAYGRATETPDHLHALLEGNRRARQEAMSHLWSAIIHQGTPWTATGPVALVVAGLLSDERIDRGEPIRANLLSFLVSVAEAPDHARLSIEDLERMAAFDVEPFLDSEDDDAIYDNEAALESFYARSILGCIRVIPALMRAMLEGLSHGSPRVRACAAMGVVTLARTESLRDYSKDLESRLLALAQAAEDTDERSAHVLALGDLGCSPVEFLEDPSPAVRMCAALAPGLAADPTAIAVLLDSLEGHAGEIDSWFVEKPPQFPTRPRFPVVARVIQQVKDFDRLVNAAIAVVGVTHKYCVDSDWGPLLAAAFSDGSGTIKTTAQHRFLGALVKQRKLWDRTLGNARQWFKQAGLPYDREACARRVKEAAKADLNG